MISFRNKTILITGGTGSWGQELTRALLSKYNTKEIRIYSRGEYKQVDMQRKFGTNQKLKFFIGDIRDKDRLNSAMKNVDLVFHLAALKHIPVCEENGWETVLTNIYGTQNIINCSLNQGVDTVIGISTDKAVEPFNLYGVTKACGEKLMIGANNFQEHKTKFIIIRAGNVIGTSGSVIPLFKEQIKQHNEITLTDESMTRFLMNTDEAIHLILKASQIGRGGEIFVLRMPATNNRTLIKVLIKIFGNSKTRVKIIGRRPGEKMDEILVSKNEVANTYELNRELFVILPQINLPYLEKKYSNYKRVDFAEFTSANIKPLDEKKLERLLLKEKV